MKHILAVDDNKQNLVFIKNVLSEEFQVTPVLSGAQAIKFLEKKRPDLILLDLLMPEMDGMETMKAIKHNSEWSDIPIIFLTADTAPETKEQCLKAGAAGFILKPFVLQEMIDMLRDVLK